MGDGAGGGGAPPPPTPRGSGRPMSTPFLPDIMFPVKKLSGLLTALVLTLILTVSAGCQILVPVTPPSTTPRPEGTGTPLQPGFTITMPPGGPTTTPLPSIADVVARVKPSVVAINVEITQVDIFGRPVTSEGAGSGWIIDPNGIIVTNNHVVEGATRVTVVTDDGRTFNAPPGSIATDALADLAVIRIDATNLPAAAIGDSGKLRVGDWVVAIGNSLGQGIRATVGIVSQQSVSIDMGPGQTLSGLIETDAAINPGNSGGPLVNMAGQVIGINSVKISQVGVEGVGYAIGTGEAAPIIQQLVSAGYVSRPYLGVRMDYVNQVYAARYGLSVTQGALIVEVVPGGPADAAGIKAGDVIVKFAGRDITGPDVLRQAIHQGQMGQRVDISYWRGQTQNATPVTLGASPKQ
jgi:serine protease Do